MEQKEIRKVFDGPAAYQIIIKGRLDPEFMGRISDLSLTHNTRDGKTISTLTGDITDQEALSGLINILVDHRFSVISVLKLDF